MMRIICKLAFLLFYYLFSYIAAFLINRKRRSESDIFHVSRFQWESILINGFVLAIALGMSDMMRR